MGALEKVLLAAQEGSEQEVHDLLMKQCPWYTRVCGGENPGDPGCGGETALTPRTPEASTVDQPTVPPGGPGLFHVKGMHLPPYIQHLYKHLVGRYGKKGAYRVAVGVVKKWAAGINPGGKKPTKTHPDVQGAAGRNVAEWEADKARAHGRHVAATLSLAGPDSSAYRKVPTVAEPPPAGRTAVAMGTAHRVEAVTHHVAHARQHLAGAMAAKAPADRSHHAAHLVNHLERALAHNRRLAATLRSDYPAEGRELTALEKVVSCAVATDPAARAATTAHLAQTVAYQLAHTERHARAMLKPAPAKSWDFNAEHASRHCDGALEHIRKLAGHLKDNYPAEGKILAALEESEQRGVVLAAPAADPWGKRPERTDFTGQLPPARGRWVTGQTVLPLPGQLTAPGAKPAATTSSQLRHQNMRALSPSAPLPSDVRLPTSAQVLALAKDVEKDCSPGREVLYGAVKQLKDAAWKLGKDDSLHALHSLRAAQAGILSAHRLVKASAVPSANVFSAGPAVPPAEASSARAEMLQSVQQRDRFRKHYVAVSQMIDKIRRHHYHGMYGGLAEARFSVERQAIAEAEVRDLARPRAD